MSYFSTSLINILIYLTIINFIDFLIDLKAMLSPQNVALKFFFFFFFSEITHFRYFRNMICLLISKMYFDVILFNQQFLF